MEQVAIQVGKKIIEDPESVASLSIAAYAGITGAFTAAVAALSAVFGPPDHNPERYGMFRGKIGPPMSPELFRYYLYLAEDLKNKVSSLTYHYTILKQLFKRSYGRVMVQKRRYRRRGRKRRFVTKRGFGRMLRNAFNMAPPVNISFQRNGMCYGDYNTRGLWVMPFQFNGTQYSDLYAMYKTAQAVAPNESGASGTFDPPTGQTHFKAQACVVKFQWHNPMTEVVKAKFWFISQQEDRTGTLNNQKPWDNPDYPVDINWPPAFTEQWDPSQGPAYDWREYYKKIDDVLADSAEFLQTKETYPSDFPEWLQTYKIDHSFKTVFQPGETKEFYFKLPALDWYSQDHEDGLTDDGPPIYPAGVTKWVMLELWGVPTHENDGENQALYAVGTTKTGLEMCCSWRRKVTKLGGHRTKWQHAEYDLDAIPAARTLIGPSGQDMGPV